MKDMLSVERVREYVSSHLSEYRWKHTLGVVDMAKLIGRKLIPNKVDALEIAALLHDVAKELPLDDQRSLIEKYHIKASEEDLKTDAALHAFAAAAIITRDFPELSDDKDIFSAVANHTLGSPDMTVFDKIIYISDYIELGRTAPMFSKVRDYLLSNIDGSIDIAISALDSAIVMSINNTLEHLLYTGRAVNSRTINTKNALST